MRRKRPNLRGSVQQKSETVVVRSGNGLFSSAFSRLAIAGVLVIAIVGGSIWGWKSGWFGHQVAVTEGEVIHLTQRAHFSINDIVVVGRQQTGKDELAAALEASSGAPIFGFSPADAEARVARLPWVDSVIVERRLPGTVYVHLTERVPMARWQHDNHEAVIDKEGRILASANPDQFQRLPLVVGVGAPAETRALLDTLHAFPDIAAKVVACVRVGERRWDLRLAPNVTVRLPEDNIEDALRRLQPLITQQKILERDIVSVDLRLPDRLVIEPGAALPSSAANPEGRL